MAEITRVELEALTFTYGEEALKVKQEDPLSIAISVAPHTGDVATEQYVNATLLVTTSTEYPAEPPMLQLQNPQGMSDRRIDTVMTRLQSEANSLLGEMMLGSLIEAAKDAMTDMNQPEGHCIYCLEQLVPKGVMPSHKFLLRLPCYHCYHLQCFAEWWHWQQSNMQQKAAQIKKDLQSAAPQRLQEEGLLPDTSGLFAVQCPICRLLVPASEIHQVRGSTQHAPRDSQQQESASQLSAGFTPKELQKMMLQQQKRARQFAHQQKQGGIVSERYGTSLAALTGPDQTASLQEATIQDQQHEVDESGSYAFNPGAYQRPRWGNPPKHRGGSNSGPGHEYDDSGSNASNRGAHQASHRGNAPRQSRGGSNSHPGRKSAPLASVGSDRGIGRGRGRRHGRVHVGRGKDAQQDSPAS